MPKKTSPAKKTTSKKPAPKKPSPKKAPPKRGLGRGLSALMEDVSLETFVSDDVVMVDDIMDSPDPLEDSPAKDTPIETKDAGTTKTTETKSEPGKPGDIYDHITGKFIMSREDYEMSDEEREKYAEEDAAMEARIRELTKHSNFKRATAPAPDHNVKSGVTFVEIGQLERNPEQPRRNFDGALIRELSDSIRQKGILQPILVRPLKKTERNKPVFQIVAGERRWQAAMLAELETLPVFVREITDQEALEIGVIENVQRAELNPMEEAMAYKALINQFGRTQEDVAEAVGKSRSYVANMMRLLTLPEKVQDYLAYGEITTGHARAIIAAPDPTEMANVIVANELSVRDAEDWARKLKNKLTAPPKMESKIKAADEKRIEAELIDALGLTVDLRHKGPNGELRIKYKTNEQLDDVIARLKRKI